MVRGRFPGMGYYGALLGYPRLLHKPVVSPAKRGIETTMNTSNNATRRASVGAAGNITVPFSKQRENVCRAHRKGVDLRG